MQVLNKGTPVNYKESCIIRIQPVDGDNISSLRDALRCIPDDQSCTLILEHGDYHFYSDHATELFCFVSNNSEGLKRIAVPLIGIHDLTIDGQGSRLIFHGRVCPFLIRNCTGITLKNFSVDYVRPFVSQGTIQAVDTEAVTVRMDTENPYYFDGGRIWFSGDCYHQQGCQNGKLFKRDSFLHCLEFDTHKRETAYGVQDHYKMPASGVSEIEEGLIRLATSYPTPLPQIDNTLVISHDHRDCFGVCIDESSEVTIEGVDIYHTGAMAFIAQRSDTISLLSCTVAPHPNNGRMVSSFADASHFVNCRGLIRIIGCRFENMLDDPVNVHGIYSPVCRIIDKHTIEVMNGHHEQAGIPVADRGAEIRFVDQNSLLPIAHGMVKRVESINRFTWRVEFVNALPSVIRTGDCIESLQWVPDVEIRDCVFGKNRARGPLISTAGSVKIEGNHFHHAGSAIKISGDCNDWFESGAVKDVLIRNNIFDNCGYGKWGTGIIAIDPEIRPSHLGHNAYHQNISLIENEFRTFHQELIFARSVDGLIIQGNRIEKTRDYPEKETTFEGLKTEACLHVQSDLPSC
ncbi:MAG TPA: hypothetical protein DCX06_05225 [Opitutae bacterium]|nr:hypothetical protein [Opitutae bacterium]